MHNSISFAFGMPFFMQLITKTLGNKFVLDVMLFLTSRHNRLLTRLYNLQEDVKIIQPYHADENAVATYLAVVNLFTPLFLNISSFQRTKTLLSHKEIKVV
jgi:hypothetical protein